jgi:hypothetical protein
MVTRRTDLDHVIDDGFTALLEHGADHIKIIVGPSAHPTTAEEEER